MTANFKFCLSTSIVHEIKCIEVLLRSLNDIITIIIAVITTHIVNAMVILFSIVIIVFHKFIIEGTVGYGSSGDIALDDLTLLDGNCKTIITQSK